MTPEIIELMLKEALKYPTMLHEQTPEGLVGKCPVCGELCPGEISRESDQWRWVEYGYHRVDKLHGKIDPDLSERVVVMAGRSDPKYMDDGDVGWVECSQGHRMLTIENMEINWG